MLRATATAVTCIVVLLAAAGCDMVKLTTNTTAKVLERAQPAMKQESDYALAAAAIPGNLKTVEGFHIANPDNRRLVAILAEGYCQYSSGFVEDDWEAATLAGELDRADRLSARATKMYVRCMNYGLELLGDDWKDGLLGDADRVRTLVESSGEADRTGLMWTAIGLAGAINHNRDDIEMVSHLPKVTVILDKVVALDDASAPDDPAARALPHMALGMLYTSRGKGLGGSPEEGKRHFTRAIEVTGGEFLLAKVLYARNYGVVAQKPELFRSTLVEVLKTDPATMPEQRLANEIAHRKARRYLKHEKEWF